MRGDSGHTSRRVRKQDREGMTVITSRLLPQAIETSGHLGDGVEQVSEFYPQVLAVGTVSPEEMWAGRGGIC